MLEGAVLFASNESGELTLHLIEDTLRHDLVPQLALVGKAHERPADKKTERQKQQQSKREKS